eukprot:gene31322-6703_t
MKKAELVQALSAHEKKVPAGKADVQTRVKAAAPAPPDLGVCCPGCDGIGGLQIGGGAPRGGVACTCPQGCTTIKYQNGFTPAYPTAENPVCGKFSECDQNTNFGYCCPGCQGMGSVTISGNGVSCGCNGCPAATTLKPAVVVTTALYDVDSIIIGQSFDHLVEHTFVIP